MNSARVELRARLVRKLRSQKSDASVIDRSTHSLRSEKTSATTNSQTELSKHLKKGGAIEGAIAPPIAPRSKGRSPPDRPPPIFDDS